MSAPSLNFPNGKPLAARCPLCNVMRQSYGNHTRDSSHRKVSGLWSDLLSRNEWNECSVPVSPGFPNQLRAPFG